MCLTFQSANIINEVESYVSNHPSLIVIDPIPNVRQLVDRYKSYNTIRLTDLNKYGIFQPNYCEISTNEINAVTDTLNANKITYPFICKPQLGHGSQAHKMLIVFNKDNLADCKPPCVAQSFINHNAILYKIFIVGDRHYYVERPSVKNFYAGHGKPIFFNSGDVCKAGSQSTLSVLDPEDRDLPKTVPNPEKIDRIGRTLREAFGMDLLGVDIVIERDTENYFIIDVNVYPGVYKNVC